MKKIVKTLIFFIGDTVILFFTKVPIINFLFITILKYMARFGKGTNFLAQNGVMVYPIHFYYPVPDILKLKDSNIFDKISPMSGIDFNEMGQLEYLKTISFAYGKECNFPASKTSIETQYFTENGMFSYGCAAFLHTIIRNHKPAKFIEVGSGNSSKVINKALDLNKLEGKIGKYIVIDPFPMYYIKDLSNLSKSPIVL